MTERTFKAAEMREWADQFEPPPLVSMSIGVRDCRNTAAMLRQGAEALERWEALKELGMPRELRKAMARLEKERTA